MKRKTLSIVVPVYYNEGSLPELFQRLLQLEKVLKRDGVALELIFVDDGSKDGSLKRLLEIKAKRRATKVIKLTRNFGAVQASKVGLQHVSGDAFMTVAADLQDPPQHVEEMVRHWLKGAKFVIVERITRDDPWHTRLASALFYSLVRRFVIRDFPMGGFDLALMDRQMLEPMAHSAKTVWAPLLGWWLGFKPVVLHYHRPARQHGRSRWTLAKRFHLFLDVLLGFSIAPIRIISGVGALVSVTSFAYGTMVVVNGLLNRFPVQGFATTVALLSFLLGLIILMLGVIGEYLWRIFEELNHRPSAVIEKVY